ncbi:protein CutA homolog isoform X3 [Homarus americanus]|uniref:protein CutA homolog isoform X3 n=1 Tax=Homarus americanus TaxID=6706 RepID=UPI001C4839C9|nr:protein CutA homolog isoform X3 [Homarus americanus]
MRCNSDLRQIYLDRHQLGILVLVHEFYVFLYCGLVLVTVCMPLLLSSGRRLLSRMAASASYVAGTHSMAFVTAPSQEVAKKIARYEWKEEICEDAEVIMMIKTRTSRLEELTKYVRENHPYDVCEVISSKIDQGNPPYLDWISEIVPEKK